MPKESGSVLYASATIGVWSIAPSDDADRMDWKRIVSRSKSLNCAALKRSCPLTRLTSPYILSNPHRKIWGRTQHAVPVGYVSALSHSRA
jgi:hypothetical protein